MRDSVKWLEIIELRSVDSNLELLESQLQKLINEVDREKQKQTMKYYRRVMINTDFSIHLFNDSNIVENSGSQLGLRLASSLKEWGSVNHYVWIEALSNF